MADTVKIAVCDDEKRIRSYLISLIRKQDVECGIMEYASADEHLADGKEHDLVFLDIETGGPGTGMDGMGLARHIRGMDACRQPVIIFVTGYEKYVFDAFDVGAFQYLVKPVDEQKSADVFSRAMGQFYRIHRGYLINHFHVEGYDKTEVRMGNGDKLLLSRDKYDGFVQAYIDYISEESL